MFCSLLLQVGKSDAKFHGSRVGKVCTVSPRRVESFHPSGYSGSSLQGERDPFCKVGFFFALI